MAVAGPRPEPGGLTLAEAAGLAPGDVLLRLETSMDGLRAAEAAIRLRQFGPNTLGTHRVRAIAVILRQVRNPLLILLLAAALVSGLTGGGTNAVIIAMIVALSAGLGFANEYQAERAMEAVRAQIQHRADVRRGGQAGQVPVADLVPGDLVSVPSSRPICA
jgi:Mg2+-importing ATPase